MRFLSSLLTLAACATALVVRVPQETDATASVVANGDDLLEASAALAWNPCQIKWNDTQIVGKLQSGTCRYTVKYGTAERWGYSVPVTLPTDKLNADQFPPMCPQHSPFVSALSSPMAYNEDCLFLTIYTPLVLKWPLSPVFVWIHGGSYVAGSVSDAGVNGIALAQSDIISVFVQYRLGILGFLPPPSAPTSPDPNLGLRDVILALEVVRDNIAAAGGDRSKVTVGGQSSGASLIRTLWGAPRARGLYHRMVLHSDPLTFGTQSPSDEVALQQFAYSNAILPTCSTFDCWKAVDVEKLLTVADAVVSDAPKQIPSIPQGETFRPQFGTVTLPMDPTNALFNDPSKLALDTGVPIMFTSTRNESGYLIQANIADPLGGYEPLYPSVVNSLINNQTQTGVILNSGFYPYIDGADGIRIAAEILLTDAVWRCPTRSVATQLAAKGSKVYIGEWTRGISYTYNNKGYCTQPGVVCHGDDLYPLFGSAPTTSDPAVTAFKASVQQAWTSFIRTGSPGTWKQWTATSTSADVNNIGGLSSFRDCPTGPAAFGTSDNPFKWQQYATETVPVLGSGPTTTPGNCR